VSRLGQKRPTGNSWMFAMAFSDRRGTLSTLSLRTRHRQMPGCAWLRTMFSPQARAAPCARVRGALDPVLSISVMLAETMGT
jgi:hypothetical protein